MKKYLVLIAAILISSCQGAFAAGSTSADVRTATFADKDTSNIYRLVAQRDPTQDGYVTFAPDTGIFYPYEESTTNFTLAYYQSGVIQAVYPTASNTQFTLPTAQPGMDYYFVSGTSGSTWKIEIQSTDTIIFIGETAGTGISNSSSAKGDSIELFCGVANQWVVKNKQGTWAAGS